jgi:hypothetical protein
MKRTLNNARPLPLVNERTLNNQHPQSGSARMKRDLLGNGFPSPLGNQILTNTIGHKCFFNGPLPLISFDKSMPKTLNNAITVFSIYENISAFLGFTSCRVILTFVANQHFNLLYRACFYRPQLSNEVGIS